MTTSSEKSEKKEKKFQCLFHKIVYSLQFRSFIITIHSIMIISLLASNFLVPNGCSFSSMKSTPDQASYTWSTIHSREWKNGWRSFIIYKFCFYHDSLFIHSFIYSLWVHTCVFWRGRIPWGRWNAQCSPTVCILRHWYRYTIEQSLEKNEDLFYESQVWA
jgi:hypothetical protein